MYFQEDMPQPSQASVSPLRKETIWCQVSRPVNFLVEIPKFGLHWIGGQKHRSLWRTVDFVTQNAIFYLHEEQFLSDILDQLICHILWEELSSEPKLDGVLLLHILRGDLQEMCWFNMLTIMNAFWNHRSKSKAEELIHFSSFVVYETPTDIRTLSTDGNHSEMSNSLRAWHPI